MIVVGLLLLAVAAALVVVAVLEGGDSVAVSTFDFDLDTPLWAVFAAGVATGLVVLLGFIALTAGVRRTRDRREEIEYLRRKVAAHERADDQDDRVDRVDRDDRVDTSADVDSWLSGAHGRNRPAPPQEGQPSPPISAPFTARPQG